MAPRHRPHRGKAGPEIELGDPFGQYEKQGGDAPGPSESGDLQSREFGVPQADIPGGLNHLVNTQTKPEKTVHKGQQPADYHKAHGVPPQDLEGYTFPQQADTIERDKSKPAPLPTYHEAVPVYEVEGPEAERFLIKTYMFNLRVHASTSAEVTRICDRDPRRKSLKVLNEDSTVDIRISANEEELQTASAQGTGAAGSGGLIWHGTNSYTEIDTQEELWAITTSGATASLSVIIVTEVAEA